MFKLILSEILPATMLLASAVGQVGPVPGSQLVEPVYNQSDFVCICLITAVNVGPGQPDIDFEKNKIIHRRVTMDADAVHLYRTDHAGAHRVVVEYDENVSTSSAAKAALEPGNVALLFLKARSATVYGLGDQFLAVTRFTRLPDGLGSPGLAGLEADLDFFASGPDGVDRLSALRILQGFDAPTPASLEIARKLADSRDANVAFTALAILCKTGKPDAVDKLYQRIQTLGDTTEPIALVSISAELGQVTDQNAIKTVELLTTSSHRGIRYGAMQSLRKMKNPQSIRSIVQRLDDSDQAIRYLAVITLAEVVGKYDDGFAPSMYLFDKNPQYYVALWKKWWGDDGSRLYPPPSAFF